MQMSWCDAWQEEPNTSALGLGANCLLPQKMEVGYTGDLGADFLTEPNFPSERRKRNGVKEEYVEATKDLKNDLKSRKEALEWGLRRSSGNRRHGRRCPVIVPLQGGWTS